MNGESTRQSRVLKWAFIIGIIIVLNLLFNVGVGLFYEQPEWENFCGQREPVVAAVDTEEACLADGGQWVDSYPGSRFVCPPGEGGKRGRGEEVKRGMCLFVLFGWCR